MTKIEFLNDIQNSFRKIRNKKIFTDFEKRQVDAGSSCIRLSVGTPIMPILNAKNRVSGTQKDIDSKIVNSPNYYYVHPKFNFFKIQLTIFIIINFDPRFVHGRPTILDFKKAMLWFYMRQYIGFNVDDNTIRKTIAIINHAVDDEIHKLDKIGYNNYFNSAREHYPTCFVGDKARYTCVDLSCGNSSDRRSLALKARTEAKEHIFVAFFKKLTGKKVRRYFKRNGIMTKKLFKDLNIRLKSSGFREFKKSSMYSYISKAIEILGIDLKNMIESVSWDCNPIKRDIRGVITSVSCYDCPLDLEYICDTSPG